MTLNLEEGAWRAERRAAEFFIGVLSKATDHLFPSSIRKKKFLYKRQTLKLYVKRNQIGSPRERILFLLFCPFLPLPLCPFPIPTHQLPLQA